MKIWEVRLSLCDDGKGKWLSFFNVETDGKEYKLVNDTYYEDKTGWVRNAIPSKIKVRHIASGYLVECGFTKYPTEDELYVIEYEMRQILNDYIEHEFNQYKVMFESKIEGLFSESN